jgi:hypothetical protein
MIPTKNMADCRDDNPRDDGYVAVDPVDICGVYGGVVRVPLGKVSHKLVRFSFVSLSFPYPDIRKGA